MAYKTVLVHCDANAGVSQRAAIAASVAQACGGHLIGLHVRAPFEPAARFNGGITLDQLYRRYEQRRDDDQAMALSAAAAAAQRHGIELESRVVEGPIGQQLARWSRCSDLVVVGQYDPMSQSPAPIDLAESIALAAGRPVLIVPSQGMNSSVGKRVLVCWNGSREAARAASDAMPLLKAAEGVTVIEFGQGRGDAAEAASWLRRHDIDAKLIEERPSSSDVTGSIISHASSLRADLIVMGLYGHGRVHELVLGGVSRSMLRRAPCPLLVAH